MDSGMKNPLTTDSLAAEVSKGTVGYKGMPEKLKRYSTARLRALEMQEYCIVQQDVKMSNKLANCANYLVFRHYFRIDEVRLHAAQFCKKHLLCPMCAIRRGAKMLKAYLEKYQLVIAERPSLTPYLVTLTVKNGLDLDERVNHLRQSMKKMTESRRNALKGLISSNEFSKSAGGFHSVEVTNRGNGWHPHVHMIWLCSEKPNQFLLSKEWQAITGDSYIVDVRPLHDPIEGFLEVCKYALKFSDLSLSDNYHAFKVMAGMRLIDSHGILRGVVIPDSLLDEIIDSEPYVELFYQYLNGLYRQTSS
ncbi:hypothetical protein SAMN05216333_1722 [Nitrosomonas oligotropha]|uniref:Uncharacterized protein n=2 Tax=Nitrosomonas oligotropha TaxID=42354 RepID=A0A1H8VPL5_9PROT|nr:protein rep [Nitrosomonas oligotropha]SDX64010.1 hypothetical protein SAMN05216300_1722 [Nitrosomonas oligotropha]SEP17351.1 hypothetical protein SAMN05216333_1722 [Nitrosomonas oligotropha]